MKIINKYLTEKTITSKVEELKPLVQKPKTAKHQIDGVDVQVTLTDKFLIFAYPSKEAMITYNLIQVCDELNKKYTQKGLRGSKIMDFKVKI